MDHADQRIALESADEACHRLVNAFHPEKVILFGSYAWGSPTSDSDLDFLVIVADSDLPPHKRAQIAYRSLMGLGVPCDVVVQTRAETERLSRVVTSLTRQALDHGRVLHG